MRILMVLSSGKYPPDRRVEREAQDLIKQGHSVFLVARRGPEQSKREVVDGVHVERVWMPFQGKGILCDLAYYLAQRYWIMASLLVLCRRHQIQAIHVHDLPYAFAATVVGKMLKLPVIFDMHEHYTAMVRMGFETPPHNRVKALASPLLSLLSYEERFACWSAHRVIVVADEHIPRVVSQGTREERIEVLTNTDDPDQFARFPLDPEIREHYADQYVILYIGVMNAHRGLETAIDAMPTVLAQIPNAKLVLIGDGPSRKLLEDRVRMKSLWHAIEFPGYRPFSTLPSYVDACAVGLIPHVSTPHTETTMPNKIFQYMILGRPVIVSNLRPLERVVSDAECGVSFIERDPDSLAQAIIDLQDAGRREEMGRQGSDAVLDRYNWPANVQGMLSIYSDLDRELNQPRL